MTVSSTTSRADYTGNGVTTSFTIPFRFLDNSHLLVIRTQISTGIATTLALTTDYTVAGAGGTSGTLTALVAPTSDQRLSILRNVPATQQADYVPNDPFPAETHEAALDKLTMLVQQVDEEVSRSLTLPPNTTGVSTQMPAPSPNKFVAWNDSATALQNVDAGTLATVVAYGTANGDLFSGNGVQTQFTLSANPGALDNLRVSIGGLIQRKNIDYTWNGGTTLTFIPAPPSGTNNIFVQYMQALPQGTMDSAATTFLQLGAGAVTRSAQSKLREFISVKDFIPVGVNTATTDCTAFFIAARNYVASIKGRLYIPNGTYRLQPATDLSADDTEWHFEAGAILKLVDTQATTSFITFTSPTNQKVFGMRVDANRPIQNPTLFGEDNCAVLVVDATNCVFYDTEIINSPGKGFALVSTPGGFNRSVSILNFTGADCKEQVLIVDGNNITGFFERIIIDGVKIGPTSSFGLCLNDGASKVQVNNVVAETGNIITDAVYIRDSFDIQLSNIQGSSARNGIAIERLNGYTGRIEMSNVCGKFNEQNGILLLGAEDVTASALVGINNKVVGINITQTGGSYRSKNINIASCSGYDNRGGSAQQDYGLLVAAVDVCRVGSVIAYGNTVRNVSILRATTSNVIAPIRQVASGTTGSIPAGSQAVITLNWPETFDDASIDIESAYVFVGTSSLSLSINHVVAITQSAVQVMVSNLNGGTAFTGTLTVVGTRAV